MNRNKQSKLLQSLHENFAENARVISRLRAENQRLLQCVWRAYPNFYRKLPRAIHLHVMTFLDCRKLDVLCLRLPNYDILKVTYIATENVYSVKKQQDKTALLSKEEMLQWFNDVPTLRASWASNRNWKVVFREALPLVGTLRVTPKLHRNIVVRDVVVTPRPLTELDVALNSVLQKFNERSESKKSLQHTNKKARLHH